MLLVGSPLRFGLLAFQSVLDSGFFRLGVLGFGFSWGGLKRNQAFKVEALTEL